MSGSSLQVSWDDFLNNIVDLKALSDDLSDGWKLESNKDVEFGTYITKQVMRKVLDEILSFDYHVYYNISYSAPGLCFNVYKADGSLLKINDCLKFLDLDLNRDVKTMITQIDHPVLHRPFYTLHPCKTIEFIEESFPKSKNFVVSWISAMGPLIRLKLLNEYSKLT